MSLHPLPLDAQTAPACVRDGWSDPVPVFSDSGVLTSPSLVFRNGEGFLVGNSAGNWDQWNTIGFRGIHLGGEELAAPPGDFYFARPLAAIDPGGRLNLFWAEPNEGEEVPDSAWRAPDFTRVYHTVYAGVHTTNFINGKQLLWSTPEMIFGGSRIAWTGGRGSRVLVSPDSTLHLTFFDAANSFPVVYLRHHGRRIRQVTEFLSQDGTYPDLAFGPEGELYLAFIGPDPDAPGRDANSVFLRRSTDGGATWQAPVLVSRSGRNQAHNVKIAVTPTGEIHLIWFKNTSGGYEPEAIWSSRSSDGGRTWSSPQELAVPGYRPYAPLAVAVDSSGVVHAVFVMLSLDHAEPRLYYARLNGSAWSTPCVLDPGHDVVDPAVAIDGQGRLHVVWNRVAQAGDPGTHATAVHATLTLPE